MVDLSSSFFVRLPGRVEATCDYSTGTRGDAAGEWVENHGKKSPSVGISSYAHCGTAPQVKPT